MVMRLQNRRQGSRQHTSQLGKELGSQLSSAKDERASRSHEVSLAARLRRPQLPSEGFVRLDAVLAVIPVSRSTWWAGVRSGRFPAPVKLSPRITAWRVEDIRKLIEDLRGRH